jgi:hypothetical protein
MTKNSFNPKQESFLIKNKLAEEAGPLWTLVAT